MYGVPHPSWEVTIVQAFMSTATLGRWLAINQFLDILIAEFMLSAKISDKIFNCNEAIMIII